MGYRVKQADLLKVAALFDDEITLDNIHGPQLESMCSILGLRAYGTENMMRNQLRLRIRQLRKDDEEIDKEGVADMTFEELKQANAYASPHLTSSSLPLHHLTSLHLTS